MNISALRAVRRRAWWTLAVATLVVCAFAVDRDLGVTVVAAALARQLLAGPRRSFDATRRASNASRDRYRTLLDSAALGPRGTSCWNDDDVPCKVGGDGTRINPATGSFMSEYSGLDGGGHRYGESTNNGLDHRW